MKQIISKRPFAYVAHLLFPRDVWVRTHRGTLATRRATNLITDFPILSPISLISHLQYLPISYPSLFSQPPQVANVCQYLQANRLYADNCQRIWNLLKVLRIYASKQIFWSNYSPVWENVKRIFALKRIFASTCICFVSNQISVCELVRIFWSEYEANDGINGVCEYTETCAYEENKIHIRLDSLQSE